MTKKTKEPLTDEQYVKKGGNCCPFCRSTNIEGEGVDVNEGGASQECTCQDCNASWYDHYDLKGYQVINEPEDDVDEDDEEDEK
jgi:transposase-like protein